MRRQSNVLDKVIFFDKCNNSIVPLNPNLVPPNAKSTPNHSHSDLMKLTTVYSETDLLKKKHFLVSTVFKDQKILKEQFGIFKIYQGIDARTWFTTLKSYCKLNYQNPNEILDYLHIFLEKDLQRWYLKLDKKDKSSLDDFESLFLDKVFDKENDLEELVRLSQKDFIAKAKIVFKDDILLNEVNSKPLCTFLKMKILVIKLVYPKISKIDAIRMAIFAVADKDTRKILIKFVNSDLSDIFSAAQSIDEV